MIHSLRLAAAAMTAELIRQDVIAHNLANADTAGFRRLLVVVRDAPPAPVYRRDFPGAWLGSIGTGPMLPQVVLDPRGGVLSPTGDPWDLTIDGPGFLAVEGGRLSRGGRLGVDPEGFLTIGGARIESQGGPIAVGVGRAPLEIQPDGLVRAGGQEVGRLRVVSADAAQVIPTGGGFYRVADQAALREGGGAVRQGVREHAAASPVEELVQMIAGLRAYEAAQRVIQASDETLARAADQIARVG